MDNHDEDFQKIFDRVTAKYKNIDPEDKDEIRKKSSFPKFEMKQVDIENMSKLEKPTENTNNLINLLQGVKNQKELRLVKRQIKNRLDTSIKFRIPADIKIDKDNIKNVAQIARSKTEYGKDRANFILECRKWEKENLKDDDDTHYWTDKSLEVLSSWIGVAENDKTEMKKLFEMCKILFTSKLIPSDTKLDITSGFYLSGHLQYCFDLYHIILECPYTRLMDRAECCKFLYHSDDPKYRPSIEKHITEIIESDGDDDMRYETIACFVTDTGVATKYLNRELDVGEVDQTLISKLFLKFIKTNPDIFYVIMASEFLLEQTVLGRPLCCSDCKDVDMVDLSDSKCRCGKGFPRFEGCCEKCKEDEEETNCDCGNVPTFGYSDIKNDVCQHLLDIASDRDRDDRTRADAADVLINHNIPPYCSKAREIIHEIGTSDQTELEKTIFSNKENVHLLNDTFVKYIERKHKEHIGSFENIDDICSKIEDLAESLSEDDIFKIRRSIDRIMLETTLHTERRISTSDIFRMIWTIIHKHSQQEELLQRFIEELVDMANTCSSGHAKRLVNVMVGFTDELEGSIDIKDQLEANIKARLMATIKNHENEVVKENLLESMISEGVEKIAFINHVQNVLPSIKKELEGEFVGESWVSQKKFDRIMNKTLEKLIG
jgi:hypothetical protein